MFQRLFERSADAIWLLDPAAGVFVDCNQAAVDLLGAERKDQLLGLRPEDLSPAVQPEGSPSWERATTLIREAQNKGGLRFEWTARRLDGSCVPLELLSTPIPASGHDLLVIVSRDITQQKQDEAEILRLNQSLEERIAARTLELKASEARLQTLVEHAPEAIVVFDGETGRFLFGNAHTCRIFGVCPEDLPKLRPEDVSPEFQPNGRRSADLAREKMRETLAGGTPVFEWVHLQSSGRLVPTEVRLVKLPGEGSNLIRASITDTTERKKRERIQLATYAISEAALTTVDLNSLFQQIHSIVKGLMPAENFYIALYDQATGLISFPYHVDEVTLRPEPCPLGTGLTGYVLRLGKPLLVDARMNARKRRMGDTVTFDGFAEIQYLESGVPAAIWLGVPLSTGGTTLGVMAVQDYHNPEAYGEEEKQLLSFVACQIAVAIERKRVDQALRDSEQNFRALFAASSQGVLLHDEHEYLEVNPAAARILGYDDPRDLLGKNPGDTSPPRQPDGEPSALAAARHIADCLSHGHARFDWMARSSAGRDIPLEVILTRIEWGGRQIIQGVINDITDRKRAEAELLKTLAREKELSELKSGFISMVSHEFRTPLGVIMSSAEILESYFGQLDETERRDHLCSIQKNTRRMANLMEEVLLLGRAEAGKMDFKPAPLDLGLLCERLVEEQLSATDHKCPVRLDLCCLESPVMADERILRHILVNLLSNAIKYSPAGSPVNFTVRRNGASVVFQVRDSGIGIPEEDRPWVFRAFHRGRNATNLPGSGLGLTIVKRCVDLHHGQIVFDSVVGQGTTVTVSIPILAAPTPTTLNPRAAT